MFQRPRGTRDFLPDEMERRRWIEARMRECARRWGYREVCTPAFEELELFTLRSGEAIIQEMYTFRDKGGREMVLRPEVTAPVLRMFVNEGRNIPKPIRWFYFADCFRYERPQKGRYRQFWQFGVELIGADSPRADAEVIALAEAMLRGCGIDFEMQVGHLAPVKHLLSGLPKEVAARVMQLLDKREFPALREYLEETGHPDLYDGLQGLTECRSLQELFEIIGHIEEGEWIQRVCSELDTYGVDYCLNFGIARGLDYYTGTVFEAFAQNLGAENQVLGGGTYRLAHLFGGEDLPSCGFAIGFDRVMVSLGEFRVPRKPAVAVIGMPEVEEYAAAVAKGMRGAGISVVRDTMERSVGSQLSHAAKIAEYAIIVGRKECETNTVTFKNLFSGEQRTLTLQEAIGEVAAHGDRA
ncbi:MAG: histidine--tRNA ligase [Methanomicrobiales archaeon]|nr:histidine--tRNA ligase [Methanomicrobiales archaeon]